MITVYTKNNCPQCMMTKHFLKDHHMDFEEINVDDNMEAKQLLIEKNLLQLPVVTNNEEWISGFQPQRLQQLKEKMPRESER